MAFGYVWFGLTLKLHENCLIALNRFRRRYGSSYYDSWISGYYSYVFATRGQSSGASLVGGEMSPVLHLFVVVTVALTM